MTFAEKLRQLRDAVGMSEAKLAEASGLTFGSVHSYGLGRRSPSFSAVVKIAKALGTTCEAFSGCEDIDGDEAPKKPARTARPRSRPRKGG